LAGHEKILGAKMNSTAAPNNVMQPTAFSGR
jgi:hypothetical protein